MSKRTWLSAVALALCAVALAACGSSSSTTTAGSGQTASTTAATGGATGSATSASTASGANPAVAKLVPAKYKSNGTLTVASDASYAPNEFFASNGKTIIGMDADLMKAIGAEMGLKVDLENQTFDSIIPGLASGKYDIGASSFGDTKAREKVVDFVDYFQAGTSFFTKASGGTDVSGLAGLCGKTVAVEKGTTEQADATSQSSKCKQAGKPGVTVLAFPDQNGANLALSSGRAQLSMADSPVAAYQVKRSHGQFKLTGQSYGVVPYGLAIPKGSGLGPALVAAVKALIADGQYKKITTKWGVQAGDIPASRVKINGAVS